MLAKNRIWYIFRKWDNLSLMRKAAVLTSVDTHLDHLGVLSILLQIPLIATEEKIFSMARRFYPEADIHFKGFDELSIKYFSDHFDVIFETGKFWAMELSFFLETLHQRKMRFVFCPHGNSDKGHSLKEHAFQDISLVYGDHLLDLLKRNGAYQKINTVVKTGNYRLSYYQKNQAFYDAQAQERVFQKFKRDKPLIFYAPTWQDKENPSSFFPTLDTILSQLGMDFNLLIKLHPFLIDDHPAHVAYIENQYAHHHGVLFLSDFPPIYPLLARCDLYLGDYSSIGYDFLSFDKPLAFLPSSERSTSYESPLHRCGLKLAQSELSDLKSVLLHYLADAHAFAPLRQETYKYVFGNEKSPQQLRDDISACL